MGGCVLWCQVWLWPCGQASAPCLTRWPRAREVDSERAWERGRVGVWEQQTAGVKDQNVYCCPLQHPAELLSASWTEAARRHLWDELCLCVQTSFPCISRKRKFAHVSHLRKYYFMLYNYKRHSFSLPFCWHCFVSLFLCYFYSTRVCLWYMHAHISCDYSCLGYHPRLPRGGVLLFGACSWPPKRESFWKQQF